MMNTLPVLEPIEWVSFRWHELWDTTLPRVLLIGDSIANGYQRFVVQGLAEKARVDMMATSRALDNPALLRETETVLSGGAHRVIHFNNGLHGKHLDEQDYARFLRAYVHHLRALAPQARLIWASSTPVVVLGDPSRLCPERNPAVLRRNACAAAVMEEEGIPVHDLYDRSAGHPEWRAADRAHYNDAGQEAQGRFVAEAILALMDG